MSDHDSDTASNDQLELEQQHDVSSPFQSTDSWVGVSDSGDEESTKEDGLANLMRQSQSSSAAASGSQSTLRSPLLPIAPAHPPLSPTSPARHHTINASLGPTIEPDQPSSTPSTPPSDSLCSPKPASTDTRPSQGGRSDGCSPNPSAPSQGMYTWPGIFQGNLLSIPSSQSSRPGGSKATANL